MKTSIKKLENGMLVLCVDGEYVDGQVKTEYVSVGREVSQFLVTFEIVEGIVELEGEKE